MGALLDTQWHGTAQAMTVLGGGTSVASIAGSGGNERPSPHDQAASPDAVADPDHAAATYRSAVWCACQSAGVVPGQVSGNAAWSMSRTVIRAATFSASTLSMCSTVSRP